jgi:uncharacterized protein (TIGR00369 family)
MTQSPAPFSSHVEPATAAEWAGWHRWAGNDPFEDGVGPFFVKRDALGIVTGFRPEAHNLNAFGIVHGGCMMTFADYSLFMIAASGGEWISGVTVTLNCEFVSAATAGDLLLARGELVRGGRSLVFARGMITTAERTLLAFSGTIKRTPAPPSQ